MKTLKTLLIASTLVTGLAMAGNKHKVMEKEAKTMKNAYPSSVIQEAEKALSQRGYAIEKIDGELASDSNAAIKKFQTEKKLNITGSLNAETLEELNVDFKEAVENKKERHSKYTE